MRQVLAVMILSGCGGLGDVATEATCTAPQAGAYCGNDQVDNSDPSTLYECPGAGQAPTSAMACPNGCVSEAAGIADHCKAPTSSGSYRLPWRPSITMQLTQDCNDSCCADHVGTDKYAYDWANGGEFTIVAARGGTISHLKINSTSGCGTSGCVNQANVIVIDHGDGTQSTYLHLKGDSLAPGLACGGTVAQGQPLAQSGTTGWSTGVHLHFQVSGLRAGAATCECGADGRGCDPGTVPWSGFWVDGSNPSLAVAFDEWADAASCSDRRMAMPASQNE